MDNGFYGLKTRKHDTDTNKQRPPNLNPQNQNMTHMTFFLVLLLFLHSASSTATTITLPLSQIPTTTSTDPPQDIYQNLHRIASASLSRAHQSSTTKTLATSSVTATALSPHSYGGYSVTLAFGTPPQQMPFIMDTGSDFVWFPCTHNYICKNCPPPPPKSHFHSFIPKLSSTAQILGCLNKKCGWAHHNPDPNSRCNKPSSSSSSSAAANRTQICPPYIILYGSGSTGGLSLLDTLDLDSKRVPEFLVGCSLFSSSQPAGIAGFGRGPASLPSQLGLTKFSFCLLSRRFDDSEKSTSLDLVVAGDGAGKKTAGVSYTPFLKNPKVPTKARYSVYYYLGLRRIEIGGKHVKIPFHYLAPADPVTGSGGTIVDSGTTFTYMTRGIYGPLVKEFESQVKGYKRDRRIEELTGLGPCFDLSGAKTMSFPSVTFHFKGGAKMELPLANYLVLVGNPPAACLTIVTDGVGAEGAGGVGPAVILGSFQMQNFYVEYDLKNERFGFKQQKCG